MTQRDRDRLVALKKARKGLITQRQAAEEIGQSERHVRRLLNRLKGKGDAALLHALRGRQSNRKLDEKTKQKALEILRHDVYRGFGPTLAAEYLNSKHDIQAGRETVRTWMIEGKLWRASRQSVDKIHQWRPRRSRVGEMVQWDTSEHAWLEDRGEKLYLISMIDDASSRLHARFVLHDSTEENMRLVWSYVELHGRPVSYYTDKAGLFVTAPKTARYATELPRDEREPLPPTQIGRALRELDIVWIGAHSPQAKGRVERSFQTAQDRLVKGLRVAGRKDPGTGQCLSGNGVHRLVEQHDCRGSGQQRRCAPTARQRTLAGCFVELRRAPAGQQWLYDSGRQADLQDCTQRHSCGPARSRCTGRNSARRINGSALRQAVPNSYGLPAAPQSAEAKSDHRSHAQDRRATCQKHLDAELSTDQPRESRAVRYRSVVPGPRLKTNSVGRAKTARPTSRFIYSASARESHQSNLAHKSKTPGGYPAGPG